MESDPRVWIAALRGSHERLAGLVKPLSDEQLRGQSYCRDWTIAQVLSHLGSGAEISLLTLRAALDSAEPPGWEVLAPIWDAWNAKDPDAQVADALAADARHIAALERASDDQLARVRLPMFGMEFDAAGLVQLRVGEHALHTWDVAVSLDPSAVVASDAVSLLIDNVAGFIAPRIGRPQDPPFEARITTTAPDRDYLLTASETVSMTDWPGSQGAESVQHVVEMPAEALVRLAYGRLDPEHTPPGVSADPQALDRLRKVFPGI